MPVALILVEALSPAYVSRSTLPVLWEFVRDGYGGPIQNLYAFCGVEATLFSGRMPAEHGVWGAYRQAPVLIDLPDRVRRPIERAARLAIVAGDALPSDRLRREVRFVVDRLLHPRAPQGLGNLIPPELLGAFRRSTPPPIWAPGSLGATPTLFDELRVQGMSFATVLRPSVRDDADIPGAVAARLIGGERPDFWYIGFSALDGLGHRHGPDATALDLALARLDRQLAATIAALRAAYGPRGVDIVIVADHGMSAVRRALDVRPALSRAAQRAGVDLRYFLDATTLRAWGPPETMSILAEELAELPGLRLLDPATRTALGLPADPDATGDLLAAIDEGAVIFPDFFRRERAACGMHGYASVKSDAGRPYLALGPALASLLPGRSQLDHRHVWAAIRTRLGLSRESRVEI